MLRRGRREVGEEDRKEGGGEGREEGEGGEGIIKW